MRKLNKKGLKQQGGATQEQMMQQQMMQQQQAKQQAQQEQPSLPEMIQAAMQEDGMTLEQVVEELKFNGVEDEMIFNALSQLGYKQKQIIPLLKPQQQKSMDMNEAFKMQQEIPKAKYGIQHPSVANRTEEEKEKSEKEFKSSYLARLIRDIYDGDYMDPNRYINRFRRGYRPQQSINTLEGAFQSIGKGFNKMGLGLNIGKKNRIINREFEALRDNPEQYIKDNTFIGYNPETGFDVLMSNPEFMTPEQKDYFLRRGKKLMDLDRSYGSTYDYGANTYGSFVSSPDLAMMSGLGRGAFNPMNYGTDIDNSMAGEEKGLGEKKVGGVTPGVTPDPKKKKAQKTVKQTTAYPIAGLPQFFPKPETITTPLLTDDQLKKQEFEKSVTEGFLSGMDRLRKAYSDSGAKQYVNTLLGENFANTPKEERKYKHRSDGFSTSKEKIENVEKYTYDLSKVAQREGISLDELQAIMAIESGGDPTASSGAAFGLMQITKDTWEGITEKRNEENKARKAKGLELLPVYKFTEENWKDPEINIDYGGQAYKSKIEAVRNLGVPDTHPKVGALRTFAYNVGQGTLKKAIQAAKAAGSDDPFADALNIENVKTAVNDTGIYSYYLTGRGKRRNKHFDEDGNLKEGSTMQQAKEEAIALKAKEGSKYPSKYGTYHKNYFQPYYGIVEDIAEQETSPSANGMQIGGESDSIMTEEELLEKYGLLPKVTTPRDGRYGDPSQLQTNQQITPIDSPSGMYPGDLFFDYMTNIGQYNAPIDIALDPITQTSKTTPFGPENMDYNAFENSGGLADLTRFAMGPYESDIYEQDEEEELKEYPYSLAKLETSPIATIDVDENYLKTDTEEELIKKLGPQTPKQKKQFDLRRFTAFSEGLVDAASGFNTLFDRARQSQNTNLYNMSMADNMAMLDGTPSRGYYAVNPGYLQPDFKASNFPIYNPAQTVKKGKELPKAQFSINLDGINSPPYLVDEHDPLEVKITDQDVNVAMAPGTKGFVKRKQKKFDKFGGNLRDILSFLRGAKVAYKPTPYPLNYYDKDYDNKVKVFDKTMVALGDDDVRDVYSFFDVVLNGGIPSEVTVKMTPKQKKAVNDKLNELKAAARQQNLLRSGGMVADVSSDMIAKLIAAGAKIEML